MTRRLLNVLAVLSLLLCVAAVVLWVGMSSLTDTLAELRGRAAWR